MSMTEVKDQIANMSAAEVAEVQAYVREVMAKYEAGADIPARESLSFDEAAEHVRSNYRHLLHKLSQ
jgi:uncharacterized alkaline shock family protein YloU